MPGIQCLQNTLNKMDSEFENTKEKEEKWMNYKNQKKKQTKKLVFFFVAKNGQRLAWITVFRNNVDGSQCADLTGFECSKLLVNYGEGNGSNNTSHWMLYNHFFFFILLRILLEIDKLNETIFVVFIKFR